MLAGEYGTGVSTVVGTSISREGSVGVCDSRVSRRKDGGRTIQLQTSATQNLAQERKATKIGGPPVVIVAPSRPDP